MHCMNLVQAWKDGWHEFFCEECGRRLQLRWESGFERIVLEEGNSDPGIHHVGFSGNVKMGISATIDIQDEEDVYLDPDIWGDFA